MFYKTVNSTKKMLIDTFKIIVNNLLKEIFYKKKKIINILIVFFIFYKSCIKTFLVLKN